MKLFLITAPDDFGGWDTYDSAVVSAKSAADAKKINPSEFVTAEYLGETKRDRGVILASFNAG